MDIATSPPKPKRTSLLTADPGHALSRLFATRTAQFGWFVLFALISRASVLGDLSYFNDELFYFLAGQRMHDGQMLYVDVWDRKGPGLFLTYYLIAGISRNVVAYQLAALLSAAATAQIASMIAERFAGRLGAMLAGTLYLATLPMFGGAGGQSPVFYNLYMALAVLMVIRALPALRAGMMPRSVIAAMLTAGVALTFKQTAICEALFLGCYVLWQLHTSGASLTRTGIAGLQMAIAGVLPFALFGLAFALVGHFAEFWHAMVTSNLHKTYDPAGDHWVRIGALSTLAAPAFLAVTISLALPHRPALDAPQESPRAFLLGWLLAALAGVAMVPNFYEHYMLPLMLPLCVASARIFDRKPVGLMLGYAAILFFLLGSPALNFAKRQLARTVMTDLARDISARDPHPRLLIYEGPIYLYKLLDSYPPTALLDSFHLYFPPEDNVSHLDTAAEMRRILAWKPSVVVTYHDWPVWEENQRTATQVHAYTKHCRLWFTRTYFEIFHSQAIDVYGDCVAPAAGLPSSEPVATGR
ncbi:MAG: hypothetical protein ABJA20_12420 [Novosphingobium sp.]